MIFNTTK